MVSGRDFDQLLAARKPMGKLIEEVERADEKRGADEKNGRPEDREHQPNVGRRFFRAGQPIVPEKNQDPGDNDQGDQSDHSIEQDCQQPARLFVGRLFPEEVGLDDVAAGSAGEKLVIKHPDDEKSSDAGIAEVDALDPEKDLPANDRGELDD
jgi:hypothetical protein